MAPLRILLRSVIDEQFQPAILLGVASIPFTVGVNWALSPDPISATPLFIACVMSGYFSRTRSGSTARAGAITGLVGGIPMLVWQSWNALIDWWDHPMVMDIVGNQPGMAAVSVAAAMVTVVVLVAVTLFLGMVGGLLGNRLHRIIEMFGEFGSGWPRRD